MTSLLSQKETSFEEVSFGDSCLGIGYLPREPFPSIIIGNCIIKTSIFKVTVIILGMVVICNVYSLFLQLFISL